MPRGSLAWLFCYSVVTPAPARPPPEACRTVTGVLAARGPPAHPCVRALHVLGLLLAGTRPSAARPFTPSASCHPHSEEAPRPWQRTPSRPVLPAPLCPACASHTGAASPAVSPRPAGMTARRCVAHCTRSGGAADASSYRKTRCGGDFPVWSFDTVARSAFEVTLALRCAALCRAERSVTLPVCGGLCGPLPGACVGRVFLTPALSTEPGTGQSSGSEGRITATCETLV